MANVAAGKPKLKLGEQAIQWVWIRGQVARLHLSPDRLAALLGVMAGDAVPEQTAMKWNKGLGLPAAAEKRRTCTTAGGGARGGTLYVCRHFVGPSRRRSRPCRSARCYMAFRSSSQLS
jgi:hypothetical protein